MGFTQIAGHARFHPYREENDNHLAFAANLVVVLTFFIGLLLFADAEEGRYDGVKTGFGAVAAGVIYGSTSGFSDLFPRRSSFYSTSLWWPSEFAILYTTATA